MDDLWQALYQSYNTTQDRLINLQILDEILSHQQTEWSLFSKVKFIEAINKCCDLSTLGPDQISQSYKALVNYNKYLDNIVNIANSCINLGYLLSHFKMSMLIIIPKPDKPFYNTLKTFQPIVLLNMLGKQS